MVLPVIHVEWLDQALVNAAIARQAGCHGVFLINLLHVIENPAVMKESQMLKTNGYVLSCRQVIMLGFIR